MRIAMMILLTGGSACGKSHYAEELCLQLPAPRYYIAAMRPCSRIAEKKIIQKRLLRQQRGFAGTFDRYTDLAGLTLPARGTVLLECLCNLTANEMFDPDGHFTDPVQTVLDGIAALHRQCGYLLIVTNDTGSNSRSYAASTDAYVQALGKINALVAQQADCVYELVCGIPVLLKGKDVPV